MEKALCLKQSIPSALIDSNGVRHSNRTEMENIIQNFYNDLYDSKQNLAEPTLIADQEIPCILTK